MILFINRQNIIILAIAIIVSIFISLGIYLNIFEASSKSINVFAEIISKDINNNGLIFIDKRYKYLIITILCIFTSWFTLELSDKFLKFVILTSILFLISFLSILLIGYGYIFEPFSTIIAIMLCFVLSYLFNQSKVEIERSKFKYLLSNKISNTYYNSIIKNFNKKRMINVSKISNVLTCKIFNHDDMINVLKPDDYVHVMNMILNNCSTFLMSKNGFLDNSNPNVTRAYFGLFEDKYNESKPADIALELKLRLENLKNKIKENYSYEINYGISLVKGIVNVGIFKSGEKNCLTATGGIVNIGRKMCQLNNRYYSNIIVDEENYKIIKDKFILRPLNIFNINKSYQSFEIYELLTKDKNVSPEYNKNLKYFSLAIDNFRNSNLDKSYFYLKKIINYNNKNNIKDPVVDNFFNKINKLIKNVKNYSKKENSNDKDEGKYKFDIFESIDMI